MFSLERLIAAAAGAPPIGLCTERLRLRPPERRDYADWAQLRREARSALQPWEPLWSRDHLSESSYRRRVAWAEREIAADRAYPFFIFRTDVGETTMVGGVTLESVKRGAAQSAALGYWLGPAHQGQGLMNEALDTIVSFAFRDLKLSRLEASCLPENTRSRRLLTRCGFREEAFLRAYLQINGAWRDHLLYERRDGERAASQAEA